MNLPNLMTKKELMFVSFLAALEGGTTFVAIKVHMEGFPCDEVIINRHDNIEDKLKYWDNVYNDELVHKFSPTISIVGWTAANTYQEIQKILD
jgi:hypothetical protein